MQEISRWAIEADVVVVGTGAAGMTAAILAHDHGAKVVLIERTEKVGGTTAVSGGGIWIPLNDHMHEVDVEDSRAEALAYCKSLAMGRVDENLIETFVDTSAQAIRYLEQRTPLEFRAMTAPDYQPEVEGGKLGGRSIEPEPFDTKLLGDWQNKVRSPNAFSFPITRQEAFGKFDAFYRPWLIPQDLAVERMMSGIVTLGQAVVAGLLRAVLDRDIPILMQTRARELATRDNRIAGVIAENAGGDRIAIGGGAAVVLASAGFEWNERLKAQFLGVQIENPNTPPFNEGDGLLMAMDAGADLANMAEVWHFPSLMIPGESYEDRPLSRATGSERNGPHVIWVNAKGKRFVNEAANYNSIGKRFQEIDTDGPTLSNLPAWAILDAQFRSKYVLGTTMPEDPDPDWIARADTIDQLARKVGIEPVGLRETIARWNRFVADGRDLDFGKGDSRFDRFQGDRESDPPNLGTIEKAPFYAIPIHTGALGTKGGPRTNSNAQVLDTRGRPIGGLYAAGNVAASVTGPGYYGRGSTLGPAMTFGYLAGIAAAGEVAEMQRKRKFNGRSTA